MLSRSPIQFDLWKQLWGKDTGCLRSQKVGKGTSAHVGQPHSGREQGESYPKTPAEPYWNYKFPNHTLSILKNSKSSSVLPSCFLFDHASFHVIFQENCGLQNQSNTPPIPNIVPENQWLEYDFPFGMAHFQSLWLWEAMLVSGSVHLRSDAPSNHFEPFFSCESKGTPQNATAPRTYIRPY